MESDSDVDITAALLPPSKPRSTSKPKPSTSKAAIASNKKRQLQGVQDGSDPENEQDDDDDDDIFRSVPSLARQRNLSESASFIKSRKDLKTTKGLLGGGSFQALGLPPSLLKALLQRGFTTPTPIQRLALPSILSSTETVVAAGQKTVVARDHLCMARTGSGKTLCYLLPLLAQLLAHSTTFGARSLILVPTRELAMQVLKVGKDLGRAVRGEGEALRWAMIVGGEAMEEQFSMLAGNPDVIIATPGRLLHLIVEMSLDLRAVQYVVFDEADRLFELGFAEQLHEILYRLPPSRQTLLFSATLPSTLVGFAKAGLQNPKLIRLDVESKISKELQMAYLSVKDSEKEAALLGLLREVIQVPMMTEAERRAKEVESRVPWDENEDARQRKGGHEFKKGKKRKRDEREDANTKVDPAAHQTVLFASTKHHVEYLSSLLTAHGYAVSPIYGSMDQTARRMHLARFRDGKTTILVVTDLAARGIDVPGVEDVVNYDFPNGTRAFVHRVGRTARAGRKGWAYTFVTPTELPHLLDLELFLGRQVKTCPLPDWNGDADSVDYADQLVLGVFPRPLLDLELETVRSLMAQDEQIESLGNVARRGQRMYEKGIQKASAESYRRAKELERSGKGLASTGTEVSSVHPIFASFTSIAMPSESLATGRTARVDQEDKRAELMKIVNGFRPQETVFEIGGRGKNSVASELMQQRRRAMLKSERARARSLAEEEEENGPADHEAEEEGSDEEAENIPMRGIDVNEADEEEVEAVFGAPRKRKRSNAPGASYRDPQFYLDYEQEGAHTEKGYSLTSGDSFVIQAAQSQYDVAARGDTEGAAPDALLQRASTLKWDRKQKKFVRNQVGSDNKKLVRSESGQKLPASFKSGVFDEWKKKQRVWVPKVGDAEIAGRTVGADTKKWRHKAGVKKDDGEKRKGRTVGRPGKPGSLPGGLKGAEHIRKDRAAKAKRVARSTQPSKKNKGGPSKKTRFK